MIDVDLFFFNFLFTINVSICLLSLYLGLEKKIYVKPSGELNPSLQVSVLVPLYKEKYESIMTTVKNLVVQTYPKKLFEVVIIVEPDDVRTKEALPKVFKFLKKHQIRSRVVESDGKVKLKAHAINCALKVVDADIIGVYDADDLFPKEQVEEAARLIEEGYDAVGTRVYRYRNTVLGSFLQLDTFIWYNVFIPAFQAMGRSFPFSGEGFFTRKTAIEDVGGFPEVLTEDAYLSILMAEKRFKFVLLDSEVEELAPKGWRSNIKQRLRWYRGFFQCLSRLLKAHMPIKTRLTLLFAYWAPIICGASLITTSFFLLYWVTWGFAPNISFVAPWMRTVIYTRYLYYWSAILGYIITASLIYIIAYLIAGKRFERLAPYIIAIPFYWLYLGIVALATPFAPSKKWFKTERR